MSVGKSLARGTVNTVSSVFGIAGALVGVVGDFAEGLVESATAVDGELMPRQQVESVLEKKLDLLISGMMEFKDKTESQLGSLTTSQSDLEKKLAELTARLEALEDKAE